jgi:hypothetical protein
MHGTASQVSIALIAAASACLAASIAGAFSLVGLLMSKEQEISKFRQAWIDELRKDIGTLAAHAYQIHSYAAVIGSTNYATFWEATKDYYVELNGASMRIKLRINRAECDSRLILQSMNELESLFKNLQASEPSESLKKLDMIVSALERDAPPLLKKEWQRVKEGETIYRRAKKGALVVFVVAAAIALALFARLLFE